MRLDVLKLHIYTKSIPYRHVKPKLETNVRIYGYLGAEKRKYVGSTRIFDFKFNMCEIRESDAIDKTSEPRETTARTCFRNIII